MANRNRLVTIENEIKEMIAANNCGSELFEKIYELVYKFFLRNKVFYDYTLSKEVSFSIAEDLYMRLFDPNKTQITSWIGYINRCYLGYVVQYRKAISEIIETKENVDMEMAVVRMISASSIDNDSIDQIFASDYLRSLPKIIDDVLDNSHFYKYTKEYIDAKVSLLLSVARDRFVSYNLSDIDSRYLRVLYRVLCDRLVYEMGSDNTDSLSPVQFYLLDCNNDTDFEGGFDKWMY